MRFGAGGLAFWAGPDERLLQGEREVVERLGPPPEGSGHAFRIEIVDEAPWTSDDPTLFPRQEPAVLRSVDGRLLSSHASFTAEIDPFAARARLLRREERPYPLEAVIRTSLLARLPLVGGLPLHAAGVVLSGRGVAFFGASGAGKSTLAASSPAPVLSDELVAISPSRPFSLLRSGFWGEARARASGPGAPLALLVDLAKGPAYRVGRLSAAVAAGRLAGSVPVPRSAALWQQALAVTAEVVSRVAVVRMEWTPTSPPWRELEELLAHL